MELQTHKEELQQRNRLRTVIRKFTRMCGEIFKPVLLARIDSLNYDAAPDFVYMFGTHRGPLPQL